MPSTQPAPTPAPTPTHHSGWRPLLLLSPALFLTLVQEQPWSYAPAPGASVGFECQLGISVECTGFEGTSNGGPLPLQRIPPTLWPENLNLETEFRQAFTELEFRYLEGLPMGHGRRLGSVRVGSLELEEMGPLAVDQTVRFKRSTPRDAFSLSLESADGKDLGQPAILSLFAALQPGLIGADELPTGDGAGDRSIELSGEQLFGLLFPGLSAAGLAELPSALDLDPVAVALVGELAAALQGTRTAGTLRWSPGAMATEDPGIAEGTVEGRLELEIGLDQSFLALAERLMPPSQEVQSLSARLGITLEPRGSLRLDRTGQMPQELVLEIPLSARLSFESKVDDDGYPVELTGSWTFEGELELRVDCQ